MVKVIDERETKNTVTLDDLCEGDFFLFRNALWVLLHDECGFCKNITNNYVDELSCNEEIEIPDLEIKIKKK